MGKETDPEAKKPTSAYNVHTANRRMERFLHQSSSDLRPDQGGSYYPFEKERFRRESEAPEINPEEGKLIATVIYTNDDVIIKRVDEPPVKI